MAFPGVKMKVLRPICDENPAKKNKQLFLIFNSLKLIIISDFEK